MTQAVNNLAPKPKPESIRNWYNRTTKKARTAIVWATAASLVVIPLVSSLAPLGFLARAQTANGAITIPLVGGIWIFAFIFMFLVPSREASFRGQETLETGVETVQQAITEKLAPAAEVWLRVGKMVEREMPMFIEKLKETVRRANDTMEDVRAAAKKLEAASEISKDAKPAIEELRKLEAKLGKALDGGIIERIDSAAKAVEAFAPDAPNGSDVPANWALQSLRANREKLKRG